MQKNITLPQSLHKVQLTSVDITMAIIRVGLAVLMLLLNGLVLDTMIKSDQCHEATDKLIISLSITCIITGVSLLTTVAQNLISYQLVEECLVRYGVITTMMTCASFHLLGLSVAHFVKVVMPFSTLTICSPNIVPVMLSGIWIFAIATSFLPLFVWNNAYRPIKEGEAICSYSGIFSRQYLRYIFIQTLATVILILLLYIVIFWIAHKQMLAIGTLSLRKGTTYNVTYRYAKTVFILYGLYVLCWMPFGIFVYLHFTGKLDHLTNKEKDKLVVYTYSSAYVTAISSPIIYTYGILSIRQRFYRMFSCLGSYSQFTSQITGEHALARFQIRKKAPV